MTKEVPTDTTAKDEPTEEKLSQSIMTEEGAVPIAKDQSIDEEPFQVVLIDLKKAAKKNVIHCVEKPLMDSGDLKFVAISYRWGELHETTMDTQLGYLASITSFGLNSFFQLCRTMTMESDLKHMDYVWIDAICVDQNNYEKRKATIYQMTNIYERANYIVAVPDLHLRHLERVNKKNTEIIQGSMKYGMYIYHLIHGNVQQLIKCDEEFLDDLSVPVDLALRTLLYNHTEHFLTDFGFTMEHCDDDTAFDHIFETNVTTQKKMNYHHHTEMYKEVLKKIGIGKEKEEFQHITDTSHKCDMGNAWFKYFESDQETCKAGNYETDNHSEHQQKRQNTIDVNKWMKVISGRCASILQSMDFLCDMIQDWSTRVWVISEYHIAKKKNEKMKYWFIQLTPQDFASIYTLSSPFKFFEFEFSNGGSHATQDWSPPENIQIYFQGQPKRIKMNFIQTFHITVQQQLNRQTFLENMLKSMASRNEDRMHAILPLSDYKHKLASKEQVSQWHITNLISVKLQLYHWTSTRHKCQLLFLSNMTDHDNVILPTFATSTIVWPTPENYPSFNENGQCKSNFDLTRDDAIQLITIDNNNNKKYRLTIKPKDYYQHRHYRSSFLSDSEQKDKTVLGRLLQLDFSTDMPDMICIYNNTGNIFQDSVGTKGIYLIGCFAKNKWILNFQRRDGYPSPLANLGKWQRHVCDEKNNGFNIY